VGKGIIQKQYKIQKVQTNGNATESTSTITGVRGGKG